MTSWYIYEIDINVPDTLYDYLHLSLPGSRIVRSILEQEGPTQVESLWGLPHAWNGLDVQ